jgi:hypothetical protein
MDIALTTNSVIKNRMWLPVLSVTNCTTNGASKQVLYYTELFELPEQVET